MKGTGCKLPTRKRNKYCLAFPSFWFCHIELYKGAGQISPVKITGVCVCVSLSSVLQLYKTSLLLSCFCTQFYQGWPQASLGCWAHTLLLPVICDCTNCAVFVFALVVTKTFLSLLYRTLFALSCTSSFGVETDQMFNTKASLSIRFDHTRNVLSDRRK